jgi:hypothetical protein
LEEPALQAQGLVLCDTLDNSRELQALRNASGAAQMAAALAAINSGLLVPRQPELLASAALYAPSLPACCAACGAPGNASCPSLCGP